MKMLRRNGNNISPLVGEVAVKLRVRGILSVLQLLGCRKREVKKQGIKFEESLWLSHNLPLTRHCVATSPTRGEVVKRAPAITSPLVGEMVKARLLFTSPFVGEVVTKWRVRGI